MDPISYGVAAKQKQRIEKVIAEPDSTSGVITVPKVIAAGETITVPTGRTAVLPNVQVDGTLNVQGDVFIPSGATMSKVVEKVASTDNAIVRFDGVTGDVQNSGVIIDDNNNVTQNGTSSSQFSLNVGGSLKGWLYSGTSGTALASADYLTFNTNNTEKMRIDTSGNVGIGVTPRAWYGGYTRAIEIGTGPDNGTIWSSLNLNRSHIGIGANFYMDSSLTPRYKDSYAASQYSQSTGSHYWQTAPSGIAGNPITWTNAMTLDSSGNLTVNGSSGGHTIASSSLQGTGIINVYGSGGVTQRSLHVQSVSIEGFNVSASALFVGKNSTTSRSINAAGTINASGADYAEYEYSNGITLVKGQIVGFKADGTLTDKYSESIRFAIKSTNPSIVGGDTWGIEEIVGKRPEQPAKTKEMSEEEFAKLEEQHEKDLADFENRLEVERQKVDRIAYAGKVPINVYGAVAGQYVIAIEKEDGIIDGKLINKADMTFTEYQDAVGRVNRILDDGRAEVAVIIH